MERDAGVWVGGERAACSVCSPPPCGEGLAVGVLHWGTLAATNSYPHPRPGIRRVDPPHKGEGKEESAASHLEPHHLLPLLAQSLDAERDDVAGLEECRRFHAEPDARRRAGDDHVARLHHEELRAVPDDVRDIEDHRPGVAALALLAVHVEPHVKRLDVLDLVLGDEPGPERAEGLAALALGPLAAALDLELPLGDVVADAVAGDDVERVLLREIAGARADHD